MKPLHIQVQDAKDALANTKRRSQRRIELTARVRDLRLQQLQNYNREQAMKEPSRDPIRISDHATLRYLERAMGLNIELVRQHIKTICEAPAAFGAVCVRAEKLRFEIVNGTVVTVTPDHVEPSQMARERNQRKLRAMA